MRVRITRGQYEEVMRVLEDPENAELERSCICVMAAALRAADPGRDWIAGVEEATLAGDPEKRWWGYSEAGRAMVRRFDGGEGWAGPEEEAEFEAFSGEEGTYA